MGCCIRKTKKDDLDNDGVPSDLDDDGVPSTAVPNITRSYVQWVKRGKPRTYSHEFEMGSELQSQS
jgi:hypothetical protein